MKKRIGSLLLAAVMLLSLFPAALAAEGSDEPVILSEESETDASTAAPGEESEAKGAEESSTETAEGLDEPSPAPQPEPGEEPPAEEPAGDGTPVAPQNEAEPANTPGEESEAQEGEEPPGETAEDPAPSDAEDAAEVLDAAQDVVSSGYCGYTLRWVLDDAGTLTISGTGKMTDNTSSPWFAMKSRIQRVVIEPGATSIGGYAFYECENLTEVTIPESVTSIGEFAFDYCSSMTDAEIPSSVTSIGRNAFEGCSALAGVTIPEGVTTIGNNAFFGCSSLTSVTIPKHVTSMGDFVFSFCTGLTGVTIQEGVKSLGRYTFDNCISLQSVEIPSGVTKIGDYTFTSCWGLKSVTIPEGVTSIGAVAFYECKSLTSITMPESLTSIGDSAFIGCSSLTSITIPKHVTYVAAGAFASCSSLTSFTVDPANNTYSSRDGVVFNKAGTELIRFPEGKQGEYVIPSSVTSIGDAAFASCSGLTSVTIPSSVTSIGDAAFAYCSGLTSVTIPSSVTSVGFRTFMDCTGLTSVTIPSSVTSIGDAAFSHCSGLTSAMILEGATSIGARAFEYCAGLTDITIPSSVASIGEEAFSHCSGLTSATIPEGVTSIGARFFMYCTSLTSVTIPQSATSIAAYAFYGCTSLETVRYGGGEDDWAQIEIGANNEPLLNAEFEYGIVTWHGAVYIGGKAAITFDREFEEFFLDASSTVYNPRLSFYLCALARAAYSQSDIEESLTSLGFDDIKTSNDYQTNDPLAAYSLAKKALPDGSLFVMVVVRGTQGFWEWVLTDFNVGPALHSRVGAHLGFSISVNKLLADLDDFLGGIPKSNVTYVLTGHSLGAAVANLAAVELAALQVPQACIYDYTFACPDVGKNETSMFPMDNIFNVADARDPISFIPGLLGDLLGMDSGVWGKFGQSRWFARNWSNSNDVTLDKAAHDKQNYYDFLQNIPAFSSFKTRDEVAGNKRKLLSIFCPVDVLVCDSSGTPIAGVTDGTPNYYGSEFGDVIIATSGDKKLIVLPENGEYTVRLTGTDEGEMLYEVMDADLSTREVLTQKSFESVALTPGKEFTSEVGTETEVPEVRLFVLDEQSEAPILEVLEDGTETDIPEPVTIALNKTELTLAAGQSETLTVTDGPAGLVWTSEDPTVATVDSSGTVKALKAGKTVVHVQTADGSASATCAVLVQFGDVATPGMYYYEAVYWALENGVTTGLNPSTFAPNAGCTREQTVTFLWRVMGCPPTTTKASTVFKDVKAGSWYEDAVGWAIDENVTTGLKPDLFGVGKTCTREQFVTFLWRAAGKPAPTETASFRDVKAGAYYETAVSWAYNNGVTTGLKPDVFGVGGTCTRGQVVTFLQRFADTR